MVMISLRNIIKESIEQRIHWWKYVRPRKRFTDSDIKAKEANIREELSSEELVNADALYGKMLTGGGIKYLRLYKSIWPNSRVCQFIPDDFYYMYVDEHFAKREHCNIIDDKNLYDLLFHDVAQPRTIVRMVDGVLLSADYQQIEKKNFLELCKREERVIIKIAVESEGGKGITFLNASSDSEEKLASCLKMKNFVVQEVIKQHTELSKLHQESINTVRILTLFFEENVHILSSVVRMGVGKAMVDNASSGGIVCGINDNGTLKNRAFDTKANCYEIHPSGVKFQSVTVPNYRECVDLCRKLALRLVHFSRLISWDFAIGLDGHPVLIEANLSYGQIDFHQMCNGPIFGSLCEKLVNYVFENNKYLKNK